jgi:hypothetical protein
MFKALLTTLLPFFMAQSIHSQTTATDALALKMPGASTSATGEMINYINQNFSTDTARVRAIYVWVASNIRYDVARFHARDENPAPQTIGDVLKTKSAVCQGYSDLFAELCKGAGLKAMVVGGYTKIGEMVSSIAHAWVAVELRGSWYLFDPTWGAGYVRNDQFVPAFSNRFYKLAPADMIKDHMPFDPMFQFLNYTLTNKEFIEGQTATATKAFFNYNDTLQRYTLLSPAEKIQSEARRLEANGIRNDLILKRLNHLKKGVQSYTSSDDVAEAGNAFRQAINLFNQYIVHKYKQFGTLQDNDLLQMIDSVTYYASLSRSLLNTAVPHTDAQRQAHASNYQSLEKFQKQAMEEKEFVNRYVNTDKALRRQLFVRR